MYLPRWAIKKRHFKNAWDVFRGMASRLYDSWTMEFTIVTRVFTIPANRALWDNSWKTVRVESHLDRIDLSMLTVDLTL